LKCVVYFGAFWCIMAMNLLVCSSHFVWICVRKIFVSAERCCSPLNTPVTWHSACVCPSVCVFVSSDCVEKQPSAEAKDDAVARRLWDVSVELVHLEDSEIHTTLRQWTSVLDTWNWVTVSAI